MTTTADRLARLVAPVAEELGVGVYDIEDQSGTLRVLLDRPGGVDVDTLATASRRISHSMDEDGSFSSTIALEVSSPGLERKLRTEEHLLGAVGERVKVKLRPGVDGDRRLDGTLSGVADGTVTVTPDGAESRTVAIDDITSAHTVFEWGPAPKPGKGSKPGAPPKSGGPPTSGTPPRSGGAPSQGPAPESGTAPQSGTAATADPDTSDRTDRTEATP